MLSLVKMKVIQKIAIGYTRFKFRVLSLFSKKLAAKKAFELFSTPRGKPPKQMPAFINKAEPLTFQLNGFNINGYRWNHPQQKKILILHGFSSAAYKFSYYAEAFANKGFEVIAFDAPAHGSSEGKTVNAVIYSEMIKKVIELYGPFHGFLAHSFGGLALSLALENTPHDSNTHVVLIATVTETTSAIDTAMKMLGLKNEEVKKEFNKIIYNLSGQTSEWYSIRRAVKNMQAKILWIHDEDDDITPAADTIKVKEDNHSNIEFMITQGLGHRRIYHDEDVRKRVIDFLG